MNKIRIAGAAAGVVLVSGMVLQVSSAAFTDTTDNAANSWAAGTVSITDDDGGSAMFSSTAQAPGDSETQCIQVSYGGTVTPQSIKLTAAVTNPTAALADTLADNLDVAVEMGALGTTCDGLLGLLPNIAGGGLLPAETGTSVYSGTLRDFHGVIEDTEWTPQAEATPATDLTRAFKFTVTLNSETGNDAQGDSAGATFTWSASS